MILNLLNLGVKFEQDLTVNVKVLFDFGSYNSTNYQLPFLLYSDIYFH